MGYSKEKRNKNGKIKDSSLTENIKTGWEQKRPILFFVGGFGVLLILFYAFWQSKFFNVNILPSIVSFNAVLSSKLLNFFGQDTTSNGELLSSQLFSINVSRGCDAIEAMALFVSTTLAFPMSWRIKIIGILNGIILLFVLNLIRIITLFISGIYKPSIFEILHVQIWPTIIIIFACGLWLLLVKRNIRNKQNVKK